MPPTVIEGVLLPFASKKVILLMNFLLFLCSAELSFILSFWRVYSIGFCRIYLTTQGFAGSISKNCWA